MLRSSPAPTAVPAPPSDVAIAARAFGDDYPPLRDLWRIRHSHLRRNRADDPAHGGVRV
jgi:hypothetical protein